MRLFVLKVCSRCGAEKPVELFPKEKGRTRGPCKKCRSRQNTEFRKKPGKMTAHLENCKRLRRENPEAYRAPSRRWASKNKTKKSAALRAWRAANRERFLRTSKEWRERNRDKMQEKRQRRRASIAVPRWADVGEMRKIYLRANLISKMTGLRYEVDHVVPLQSPLVCGLHCEANLQILTRSENRAKGNFHWPDMP